MKILTYAAFLFLASATQAMGVAVVKAKVINSESKLDVESVSGEGASASAFDQGTQSALGGGAELEFLLSDPLRVGVGFSVTEFDEKTAYSNMGFNSYGTYDFITQDVFSLFGKAGLSYHLLDFEDQTIGPVSVAYSDTGLLNYDLGVGARFKLNHAMNFGLEYNFSDTFSRNDVDVNLGQAPSTSSLRNVAVRSNELVASLAYAF